MLNIVLLLLKIIGIFILSILGILLFLLIIVLFVPIRYQVKASKFNEIKGVLKVSWFFHIVSVKAYYDETTEYLVRLFGIPIISSKRDKAKDSSDSSDREEKQKKVRKPKKEKEEKPDKKKGKAVQSAEISKKNQNRQRDGQPVSNNREVAGGDTLAGNNKTIRMDGNTTEGNTIEGNTTEDVVENEKHTWFFSKITKKIKFFYFKIVSFFRNIKYKFMAICDKLRNVRESIEYYQKLFESEMAKETFRNLKKNLFWILKSIRPRRLRVKLKIGTGDPASTGQVLGIFGMLYPIVQEKIQITPDFENQIIEGSLFMKGHVTLIVLVIAALKLYFNKNLRTFLELLKNGKDEFKEEL